MTSPSSPHLQRSRGMRDLLPADMRAFRRVEDAFRGAASRWGYEEVRTPTIEPYSLFTASGILTAQMLSRVYSFLDWDGWSGERVVLRPDSTIPVARAAEDASMPMPARLFYVQNVFRFHEADTEREEWQCGIEYLGAPRTVGDIEVAAIACETLDALGLHPEVRLSHAAITKAVARVASGDEPTMMERVSEEGLAALARGGDTLSPQLTAFVQVALQAGEVELLENLRALAAPLHGAEDALDELRDIARALIGAGRTVVIDLGMPRDFDYYTGVVFEFHADEESWGRGGRYSPNGHRTPDTACGLGLDASRLATRSAGATRNAGVISIVAATASDLGRALTVARALHRGGIAAALAGPETSSEVTVTVAGESLTARTPEGEQTMSTLDEVVGMLLRYK
jgi:histidyl-tRNA synthetase